MNVLDRLSLLAMAVVLGALIHVSGTVSLSVVPLVHAIMPTPAELRPQRDAPPTVVDSVEPASQRDDRHVQR